MDKEVMRLLAHVDQTRARLRDTLADIPAPELARLIKQCAAGSLPEMDERTCLLVGLLAVVAIVELRQPPIAEDAP